MPATAMSGPDDGGYAGDGGESRGVGARTSVEGAGVVIFLFFRIHCPLYLFASIRT